jgi:molybdate-binding protein
MVAPAAARKHGLEAEALLEAPLRWALRQEGAGSQRYFREMLSRLGTDVQGLASTEVALSERDAAAMLTMGEADVAPGVRASASEFGLEFAPFGWEAFDIAMHRDNYFRRLLRMLLAGLDSEDLRAQAGRLGGYDFEESGTIVWSDVA